MDNFKGVGTMSNRLNKEPMLDTYVFETNQLLEHLELVLIEAEKKHSLNDAIDEIFRIMHTIKGSSAMMLFDGIAEIAHGVEDMFFLLRENISENIPFTAIIDIVLEVSDYIKAEILKVENLIEPNGNNEKLLEKINNHLLEIKNSIPDVDVKLEEKDNTKKTPDKFYIPAKNSINLTSGKNQFEIIIKFVPDCSMENIRAFQIIHSVKEKVNVLRCFPDNLFDDSTIPEIQTNGFQIYLNTDFEYDEISKIFDEVIFAQEITINSIKESSNIIDPDNENVEMVNSIKEKIEQPSQVVKSSSTNSYISVSVSKLDKLMDLVGEMVISEAMVVNSPELMNLPLENFHKASRQLRKITNELQDVVMSIRMVPLSSTFQKMNRIVRDMSHKLNKKVKLEIIGAETEVDKNIIEQISDPLMHLIRNAIDHGIESEISRINSGKSQTATITLEAMNSGGDVFIIVRDDGKGLDKEKILEKAHASGLINKPEDELKESDIYSYILLPGFSTKDAVSEYSGRGVGMDVVAKNIENIGGSISIDSEQNRGTSIVIKIPLTLAIIEGMGIKIGESTYTVPTVSIKESFKANTSELIHDTDGNEMILIRGKCFKILRLHKLFNIFTNITDIKDGIIMLVEESNRNLCIFADELIGEQQVVVKPLPSYIKKVSGIAGCTILGDGNISLILDVNSISH